ncbi:two-component sensor histidine kinase [Parapedobacter defluvii]|uniref:Two-component sensor histidine kinase n=1 Tax=Parapedobacter defluvii TaxID=2045106 RepID=A0ABQ1M040_9SPHI|nr:two-component sensor histidine kinase [Parapedobacter defluvii]
MAQSIDSLEQLLQDKSLPTSERINLYDDLSWAYMNSDMQKSVAYGKKGLELVSQTTDEHMRATFYRNIGVAYYMGSVYDSAATYLGNALAIVERIGEERLEAVIHAAYGNLYQKQGLYRESIESYLKAVGYFEREKNLRETGKLYANIGGIYQMMINYDQALLYFGKARELAEQTDDKEGLAGVYTSLSDIYLYKDKTKAQSLHYAEEALRLFRESGNMHSENIALQTIAKIHHHHDDYANALPIAEEALRRANELGFPNLIAHSLIILSNIHLYQGHYDQCVEHAMKVLDNDSTDTNVLRNVYANLIRAHAHLGHADLTSLYLDHYRDVLDRYSSQDYQKAVSALEVKYEAEKKELKIYTLERQRRLYAWLGIAGAIILLCGLAFAVVRYRLAVSQRKLAEKEAIRLQQEKQLVAAQAALDSEAAERSRLAKDLHDGLGSMLSVVKLNLPQMKSGTVMGTIDVPRFQKALGMLDDSIQELRRVAHHMMPESLMRYGLKASLSDFCGAIPGVDFHYFGNEGRLPEQLEILIYRCIHELVNNALKHAEATHINVQFVQEPDRVSFTVQDDGIGFDQQMVTEGMGLRNIRQRVAAFQGNMDIYSSEHGTEIHVELELKPNEQV